MRLCSTLLYGGKNMFIGSVTNWTSVVGTDIPFITELNSNNKISNTNGLIRLRTNGYWNVDASLTLSGVTGEVIVSLFADGVEKVTTYAETTLTADVLEANVSITDAIKTILDRNPDIATISLRVDTPNVVVNGKLRVEYVQ